MLDIDNGTIDRYMGDFDDLKYDLKRYIIINCKAFGLYPVFDDNKLKIAFDNWHAEMEVWGSSLISNGTEQLSHIKIFSILLWSLSRVDWLRSFNPFDMASEQLDYEFQGTMAEFDEVRKDIANGKEKYLAFEFVHQIICLYETYRLDRKPPFVPRLTDDIRHDILTYLRSDSTQSIPVYLIFKALFARDPA